MLSQYSWKTNLSDFSLKQVYSHTTSLRNFMRSIEVLCHYAPEMISLGN